MKITSHRSATSRTSKPVAATAVTAEHPVAIAGRLLVRYGLAVVIAWIGALKYTSYGATAIQPLIAHSPHPRARSLAWGGRRGAAKSVGLT
jgi:hypothetical protein